MDPRLVWLKITIQGEVKNMIFVGKAFNLVAEKVPALGYEPGAKCLPSVRFKSGNSLVLRYRRLQG
jgi:hypothetical protein